MYITLWAPLFMCLKFEFCVPRHTADLEELVKQALLALRECLPNDAELTDKVHLLLCVCVCVVWNKSKTCSRHDNKKGLGCLLAENTLCTDC